METIFRNMENSKANKPYKFVTNNLPEKLDLKSLNKNGTLQNVSICYTWKYIKNSI